MRRSQSLIFFFFVAAALFVSVGSSYAADAVAGSDRVKVSMVNPEQFTEIRQNRNRGDLRDGTWLERLQSHVVKSAAKRLAPGELLDVRITDIKRAGDFEPWRGAQFHDVRFVKDIYPPKISLSYTLTGANGAVISEGDKVLRDPGFLRRGLRNDDDPLRHEKRLLDDWLADILPRNKN